MNQSNQLENQEFKIKLSVSSKKIIEKPNEGEEGDKLRKKLHYSFNSMEITPEQMLAYTLDGYSISPFIWKNNKKESKFFQSTQMLMLDVDNKTDGIQATNTITPEGFLEKLRDMGLECTYILSSLSHTAQWPRYRVIWVLEEPITDPNLALFLCNGLVKLFEGIADKSAKDLARHFYPHKDILYQNPSYILGASHSHFSTLFRLIEISLTNIYSSKIVRPKELKSIKLSENRIYLDNIYDSTNSDKKRITNKDSFIELLSSQSNLFKSFYNLKKMKNNDLLALSTNLRYFYSGLDIMKEVMERYNSINDHRKYDAFDFKVLRCVSNSNYLPMNLQYSHNEKFKSYISIYSKGLIRIKKEVKIDIKDAEIQVDNCIQSFIKDPKGTIRICIAEVGIGKSKALRIPELDGSLFALPTHNLIHEASGEFTKSNLKHNTTSSLPNSIPQKERSVLETYYQVGDFKRANQFIKDLIIKNRNTSYAKDLENYFKQNEFALTSSTTCLTTHSRALYCNYVHTQVIIDEDVKNEIFKCSSLKLNDLIGLIDLIKIPFGTNSIEYQKLTDLRIKIESTKDQAFKLGFTQTQIEDLYELIHKNLSSFSGKILDFIRAKYIMTTKNGVEFITLNIQNFSTDKKYLILSATVNPDFYMFLEEHGFKIEIDRIPNVNHSSSIKQDRTYSMSKSSLVRLEKNDNTQIYKEFIETKNYSVITYKDFKASIANTHDIMHFNNCSGYNHLEGKNIIVIGMNNLPDSVVYLTACAIDPSTANLPYQLKKKVLINNRVGEFFYLTYENLTMQMVHLQSIEESIIQAVGRSRYLRKTVEVIILNDYPLYLEAEEFRVADFGPLE